jgi:hypothetical protein
VTGYRTGGAESLPLFDLGQCALPARPGSSYRLSASYRGTVTTQFSVCYRNAAGRWQYAGGQAPGRPARSSSSR